MQRPQSPRLSLASCRQSQTPKKLPETDLIFENLQAKDQQAIAQNAVRLSLDCKATVSLGDYSRGGKTRGDTQACDHDMGSKDKCIPCGVVNEDRGDLYLEFGRSYKTSDFIVDVLEHWWAHLPPSTRQALPQIQLKFDNGPESSGVRTQFLNRLVSWVDRIGKPLQLFYFLPLL
ncbi:MAG TPA: ISAzo13-like element transposase-related protein [Elainellaceae cyanobacterium]